MNRRLTRALLALALLTMVAGPQVSAQTPDGALVVKDSTGAVVAPVVGFLMAESTNTDIIPIVVFRVGAQRILLGAFKDFINGPVELLYASDGCTGTVYGDLGVGAGDPEDACGGTGSLLQCYGVGPPSQSVYKLKKGLAPVSRAIESKYRAGDGCDSTVSTTTDVFRLTAPVTDLSTYLDGFTPPYRMR